MQHYVDREPRQSGGDRDFKNEISGCSGAPADSEFEEFEKFLCSAFINRWPPGALDDADCSERLAGLLDRAMNTLRLAAMTVGKPSLEGRVRLPRYKLRRVLHLVQTSLDGKLTVADMADAAEMSLYHFSRKFKEALGLAPQQYVRHCRMKVAADLLRTSDESVGIIAREVGCSDQSHFTGMFKRIFGVTPAAYRRNSREVLADSPPRVGIAIEPSEHLRLAGRSQVRED